eukprot:3887350-Pyramimonas_sp.AAC.1
MVRDRPTGFRLPPWRCVPAMLCVLLCRRLAMLCVLLCRRSCKDGSQTRDQNHPRTRVSGVREPIPGVGISRRGLESLFQGLEPVAGNQRAYSRSWNQSQGAGEPIPGVGTNRRGLESIFQGLEPIAGGWRAYSRGRNQSQGAGEKLGLGGFKLGLSWVWYRTCWLVWRLSRRSWPSRSDISLCPDRLRPDSPCGAAAPVETCLTPLGESASQAREGSQGGESGRGVREGGSGEAIYRS